MNRFITESEVEDAKKKRTEEWEAARAAGRDVPDLDEPVDSRPLFERLKEQKDKKQDDFEEQFKFKNMIYKGLNDEDATFLGMVAKKQAKIDDKRFDEESEEVKQFRAAVEEGACTKIITETVVAKEEVKEHQQTLDNDKPKTKKKKNNKSSQAALIATSIRKKRKPEDINDQNNTLTKKSKDEKQAENSNEANLKDENKSAAVSVIIKTSSSLSNLADYPSSSSEDEDEK